MKKLIEWIKSSKTWNIGIWVFMACFLVFALASIQGKEEKLRLKKIEVSIEPKDELAFLDSFKVMEIIKGTDSGKILIGSSQSSIKIDEMESELERYPFIEKADVSIDLSGKLMVKILQRNPILRIVSNSGQNYYVAKNGYKMPLHAGFAPRVLIANGNIAETLADSGFISSKIGKDLLKIAQFCYANDFWHAQIEQLYVDNYMDILLIPMIGNHTIVLGSAEQLESKFELLKTFYLKGLNAVGWSKYKRINLKYQGQIVAEKWEEPLNTQITHP